VERDAAGLPLAIVAPFGQRTTLEVNSLGYLSTVTNPPTKRTASLARRGLLTAITGPSGRTYSVSYARMVALSERQIRWRVGRIGP